jgi:glycine cleavage system H lipoate-binding protein
MAIKESELKTNTNGYKVVGTRPIRHDGADKVTGRAVYGNDMHLPGMLYGKVLRSPHAHARIISIDTSAAEALPGVKSVITGADLPAVGDRVLAGSVSWQLERGGELLSVLSPVSGEVVEINEDALAEPSRHWDDPYQAGWLMKVRPDDSKKSLRDLVSGQRARQWMDDVTFELMDRMPSSLGAVMQDGGVPVQGIAQEIDPEEWKALVEDFLCTP